MPDWAFLWVREWSQQIPRTGSQWQWWTTASILSSCFRVHTSAQAPVAVKLLRTPFCLRSEVNQQIKNMELRGIIELSNSRYSAPICLYLKQMARTVSVPTPVLWMMLPSRIFLCLLFVNACILDSLYRSNLFTTLDLDLYSGRSDRLLKTHTVEITRVREQWNECVNLKYSNLITFFSLCQGLPCFSEKSRENFTRKVKKKILQYTWISCFSLSAFNKRGAMIVKLVFPI